MANYTVRLDNVTGPDVVSLGDGTTYATLSVNTNVSTPLVSDTNPTLSADLNTNGHDVLFGDNDKAIFGAGSDLQIYHDGSNSYISDQGTGSLYLQGQGNIELQNAAGTETFALFVNNGKSELYYDNAAKLATTSTGIDVTGTVTADGLTVDGGSEFNGLFEINNSSVRVDLMETDAPDLNGRIQNTGGTLRLNTLVDDKTSQKIRLSVDHSTGDISFYEDTGTTPKFFWDASAESLGIGTSSPDAALHIDTIDPEIRVEDSNNGTGGTTYRPNISFFANGDEVGSVGMRTNRHMDIVAEDYNSAQIRMFTGGSLSAVIDSSGNVGIGTSSPNSKLSVVGLPTSATGLSAGDIYIDGNTLKIVT